MISIKKNLFINLLIITIVPGVVLAKDNVRCFNIKRGQNLDTEDFILESESNNDKQISKKIYIKQDGKIVKKEAFAKSNYTIKKRNKLVVSDDFLVDFIVSTKMVENKVYEIETTSGTAHFKIKSLSPPNTVLEVETLSGALQLNVRNDGLETQIDKIFFEKSNLSLLPCDLDTKAKIFQNKDVNIFMGDKVVKVINK